MKTRIVMFLAAAIAAVCAQADTWTDPDTGYTWTYRVNGKTAILEGIDGVPSGFVQIPSEVSSGQRKYVVKQIDGITCGGRKMRDRAAITGFNIPDTVEIIGAQAFFYCVSVVEVSLGKNISAMLYTSLGGSPFAYCDSLQRVNVELGNERYVSIDGVVFNKEMTEIVVYPAGKENKEYSVPVGVTMVGQWAFAGAKRLSKVKLPNGLVGIGLSAFSRCPVLEAVDLPATACCFDSYIFYDCPKMADAHGLVILNNVLFSYVDNEGKKVSVDIPSGVEVIAENAFENASITAVTIPSSVRVIEGLSFSNCENLRSLTFSDGLERICHAAFEICPITSVSIPQSVIQIGDYAFGHNQTLKSARVPRHLKERVENTELPYYYNVNGTEHGGWWDDGPVFADGLEEIADLEINYFKSTEPECCIVVFYALGTYLGSQGDRKVKKGSKLLNMPIFSDGSGRTFGGWWTEPEGGSRVTMDTVVTSNMVLYPHWANGVIEDTTYMVAFDANGGTVSLSNCVVEKGVAIGELPTPTWDGFKFLGWYTAKDGGTKVSAKTKVLADVTYYAHWGASSSPTQESGVGFKIYSNVSGSAPSTAASEYNGYLYDEKSGDVKGTIQVKVGKPGKDSAASVKATVVVGTKKVTLKAKDKGKAVIEKDGPTEIELVGGEACEIALGAEGLSGCYGAYQIDGSRNFFSSKDKGEVAVVNDILSKWLGSFMVIWDGGSLSVSIAAKGKVKVSGKLADGKTKVSVSTVLLVGEEWSCVSVAAQKANLAFVLWLSRDGQTIGAEGLGDDVLVGKPGALANGAVFHVDADEFASVFGQTMLPYLPDGVPVSQKGTKWTLPKAGKVVYKNGAVDKSKLGDNPCALKLTYKAKEGTFKGSFKVYTEVKGKPKATTVNVTGFLLNGVGYGTATIKGKGSVAVTIE